MNNEKNCFVCCEKYDSKGKHKVKCNNPSCHFEACKTCVRQYLSSSVNGLHCMQCKNAWDPVFGVLNLNRSWLQDDYKRHRKEVLFQSEQSKFAETMPDVEKYHQIQTFRQLQDENNEKIKLLYLQINKLNNDNTRIGNEIYRINHGKDRTQERRKFIMPCQKEDCSGFMCSSYKCGLCEEYCCSQCLEMLGKDKDIEHKCDEDRVKTAELIKSTTRPCPKCGERIHKINGCDQMWCIACKTAFSWNTGKIQDGVIHNPHYFQYMRENGGILPRQPGDNPCGEIVRILFMIFQCISKRIYDGKQVKIFRDENMMNSIMTKSKDEVEWKSNEYIGYHDNTNQIMSLLRLFRHVEMVEIPNIQNKMNRCNSTVDDRVNYLVNKISKDEFQKIITLKDENRQMYVDILHIYDLIRTVGIETVHKLLAIIDNDIHISAEDIQGVIEAKTIDSIMTTVDNTLKELHAFVKYCNQQFEIISVSHNKRMQHIKKHKSRTYEGFVDLRHVEHINENDERLHGNLILHQYRFASTAKATIKHVKSYYNAI